MRGLNSESGAGSPPPELRITVVSASGARSRVCASRLYEPLDNRASLPK